MALKRKLLPVDPQPFTSNGTSTGQLTVTRADFFKVHQFVFIQANGLSVLPVEIKRIVKTTIFVGPQDGDISTRTDISAYTTGNSAALFANEQIRPFLQNVKDTIEVPFDVDQIEHEEEPVLAKRVVLVDGVGEKIDSVVSAGVRRLAVDAAGVSVNVSGINISGLNQNPTTPTVSNVSVPTAGVEQSFAFTDGTKKFIVRVRDMDANMRVAFSAGATSVGPYITVRRGNSYSEDNINTQGVTMYFQVDKSSETLEILTWA